MIVYRFKIRKSILLLIVLLILPTYLYGQREICVVDSVFSANAQNINGEIAHISIAPANSNIISFESFERGIFHYLWWMDVRNGEVNQISPVELDGTYRGAHADRDLDWNPVQFYDKHWYVFVSTGDDGNNNLYIGNTSDNMYIQLTKSRFTDHRPRWSPDGRSIVYVSARTGSGDLYLIEDIDRILSRYERWYNEIQEQRRRGYAYEGKIYDYSDDESTHVQLTTSSSLDTNPDWSPDGRFIVYQSAVDEREGGTMGLFIIDMENRRARPINVLNPRNNDALYPRWSYDQSLIAYYLSPVNRNEEEAVHNLAYLMIQYDNGRISSHSQVEVVERNVRGTRKGPSWGTGSRSLVYVHNDGAASRVIGRQTHTRESRTAVLIDNEPGSVNQEVHVTVTPQLKRIALVTYEDQDYRIYIGRILSGMFERRETDVYVEVPEVEERKTLGINLGMQLLERQNMTGDRTGTNIEFGQSLSLTFNFYLGQLSFFPLNFVGGITIGNMTHSSMDEVTQSNLLGEFSQEIDATRQLQYLEVYGGYRFPLFANLYLSALGGIGQAYSDNEDGNENFLMYGVGADFEINEYIILNTSANRRVVNGENESKFFGLRFGISFKLF